MADADSWDLWITRVVSTALLPEVLPSGSSAVPILNRRDDFDFDPIRILKKHCIVVRPSCIWMPVLIQNRHAAHTQLSSQFVNLSLRICVKCQVI